jgi:hypothetical protein
MRHLLPIASIIVLAAALSVRGQVSPPSTTDTVSREEYDRLKREQDAMRKEIDELKQALSQRPASAPAAAPAAPAAAPAAPAATAAPVAKPAEGPTNEDIDDLQKQIKGMKDELDLARPGTSNFHIGGDMGVGFTVPRHGPSTFDAGIAPLILFQPTDRVLIEAAADIGLETDSDNNSSTSFDLTIANVSFLVNDHLAVGGGLFVVPFGVYHNHFDPPWINKFPDDPLPFGDGGIAPGSEVGIFARGAVPVHNMKVTYDAYLTNGPNLHTTNPDNAGSLNFDDFTDLNHNKAVGGRIGFLPMPNVEMGYSVEFAEVQPSDFPTTDALLQAVDINYRQDCNFLKGQFDIRSEWTWSDVGTQTYDPTGALGFGPTRFTNYRQGGYVQLCFRPTKSDIKFLRDVELVSRYDWLIQPINAPGGDHEKRLTFGIDYWITPAIVVKAAYEIDDKKVGENDNAFVVQLGIGL